MTKKFLAFISGYVFIEPTLANFLSDNFKMSPGTIGIVFAIVYVTCNFKKKQYIRNLKLNIKN